MNSYVRGKRYRYIDPIRMFCKVIVVKSEAREKKNHIIWNEKVRAHIASRCREGVLTMQKFISASLANLCRKRLPYQQREYTTLSYYSTRAIIILT